MEVLPILNLPATHEAVTQAAAALGEAIRQQPLYQAYMQSIMNLQNDPQVKDLSLKIQQARNAVYSGRQPELAGELQGLKLQLEDLSVIRAYRAAEDEARALIRAVNAQLSAALNVDFAANAKRGCGCGCGG